MMVNKYQGKAFLLIGKKHVHKENAKFRGTIFEHTCCLLVFILKAEKAFMFCSLLGINFPTHQWSVLKNNFSAIEEAIKHFQLKNA